MGGCRCFVLWLLHAAVLGVSGEERSVPGEHIVFVRSGEQFVRSGEQFVVWFEVSV